MKKFLSMTLAFIMTLALAVPAFASTITHSSSDEKVIRPLNPEDVVEYSEVLSEMPPEILGTPDMVEFDNSPNIQTRASGFLFSMTAKSVKEILVTAPGKSFVEADLDNHYLHITGDLKHSEGDEAMIKIGGCWYNAAKGIFVADLYDYVYQGNISSTIKTQYAIAKEYVHRGFIKNLAGSGTISGDLSFYSEE